ncbi:MAG: GIY-YIG nuclease family protein [Candidatus Moraniibacteriota bacterium]|nr:MAG: GIY-YIG nuclease family protein [Candidatus Moranbacteria bacterium]
MNIEMFENQYRKQLPDSPGVYFFVDEQGRILYIGKATSLRDRVKSYFMQDMLLTRGPKIVRMLELATDIKWQEADSALEALLLEANLIHKHRPPYNTDAKDDKSWNHVVITKEKFPRVLIERGRRLEDRISNAEEGSKNKEFGMKIRAMFGPFPSGGSLKEAVKIVRKIFPFRDTCTPFDNAASKEDAIKSARHASRRRRDVRGCFNSQIGLCPGVCTGDISAREYGKTIRNIILFFEGKKSTLVRMLEREMKSEARALRFERASEIKKTLFALSHIQDVALLKKSIFDISSSERSGESEGKQRIESYDVAHLGGTDTVGVMTVVENGKSNNQAYRKFILRGEARGNDLAALEEVLRRRFKHSEWGLPTLIVVDGSNLQRHVAEAVLRDFSIDIPIVSVLKDEHHRPKGVLGPRKERMAHQESILLANSEAHRFAISFHRKRRGRAFLRQ